VVDGVETREISLTYHQHFEGRFDEFVAQDVPDHEARTIVIMNDCVYYFSDEQGLQDIDLTGYRNISVVGCLWLYTSSLGCI